MSSSIPKRIIQTWEHKFIDSEFQRLIDIWKLNNPTYEYYLFDAQERQQFISENYDAVVLNAYNSIIPGANKSDLFRYCYLYIHGGVAVDIDTLCIGKLDDFLLPNIDLVVPIDFNKNKDEGEHNLAFGAILACTQKHPAILDCIQRIVYNVHNNIVPPSRLDFSGPGAIGRSVNKFMGNEETASFIGKEGIHKSVYLLKFEEGTEYVKDGNNNILVQNKNGNPYIIYLYNNEIHRLNKYVSWVTCGTNEFIVPPPNKKSIALMIYGQFRTYKNNMRRNIEMLKPLLRTHNVHVFILTDKLESGNYSIENEKEIRDICKEHYFNLHFIRYIEDYDNSEENEVHHKYFNSIQHYRGSDNFAPRLIYRKYLLNKLKNEYIMQNNIHIDLTVYCRLFDIKIENHLPFDQIEKEIDELYEDPSIILGSSDTFFIGSKEALDYLFDLSNLFKEGKPYHDNMFEDTYCAHFISTMDICLHNVRATYSPELQYIAHMFYSAYEYKNMRVDFNNVGSPHNEHSLYHVVLDSDRK